MTEKEIQELVLKAQHGDKDALEKIYRHYFKIVYQYVYSKINHLHDTQEVVSDIFLSLITNLKKYKGQSNFKNFIFGIIKNKLNDYFRRKYNYADYVQQSYLENDYFYNIAEPEEKIYSKKGKLIKLVKNILSLLKPKYARVLKLRFLENYSVKETAQAMGITVNNVKVLQHRAIQKAKKIWLTKYEGKVD